MQPSGEESVQGCEGSPISGEPPEELTSPVDQQLADGGGHVEPAAAPEDPAAATEPVVPEKAAAGPQTWAQRLAAERLARERKEAQAAAELQGKSSGDGAAPTVAATEPAPAPAPQPDNFLDYFLFLARQRGEPGGEAAPVPESLARFQHSFDSKVKNTGRATYSRLGMRNDANNCYANVVIQTLLQCSALMWILSKCSLKDGKKPFYSCLANICREFHSRKPEAGAAAASAVSAPVNSLALPYTKELLSRWRGLGSQQDAGEFLFYLLGGLHDECKWRPPAAAGAAVDAQEEAAPEEPSNDWALLVKTNQRRAETRTAGLHEDSPIARIFGAVIRSIVRTRGAKADSVSLEPCNHLDLDISQASVTSVRTALEAFFNPEAVNDGQSTRRLKLEVLPNVLILNLKRFAYNRGKGGTQKIKKSIKYEEKLTVDRSWVTEGNPQAEYWMTALICHHGESAHSGHYTAVVRYNTEWFLYDDTTVRKVEPKEVAAQHSTAYLLVYQRHGEVDLRP